MPLEIRELIIKVTVEDQEKRLTDKAMLELKKSIINECTEKILAKLKVRSYR
jgi:hypothetical protein